MPFFASRVLSIVSFVINTFLLHASITRPLGESGKLKLTGDMTELEFALGIFLTTGTVQGQRNTMRLEMAGDAYKALRAFRYGSSARSVLHGLTCLLDI
jgi:hypothetical protein